MRKKIHFILIAVMTLSLVLAGCSNSNPSNSSDPSNKPTNSAAAPTGSDTQLTTEAGTYPIVNEEYTLKVLVRGNPLVENYETNEFTKWYEEKTGIHVEWEVVPEQSGQEKLNLALASGDYPDVILNFNVQPAQQMIYGTEGVFMPLNELIDQYGVETKKLFADKPEVQKAITAPDGNIYSLPEINECYHCSMYQKMWLYEPWLEKLNLEIPTTTDELYNVLKAFKEQDPNDNGVADEIPMAITSKSWGSQIDAFLMNSFIYNPIFGNTKRMYVKDGTLDVSFNKEEWREGLRYMNKLYTDGLLAPESFTQDGNQLIQIGENPDTAILGASTGGHQGVFTQLAGDSGRWLEYKSIPALKGPSGAQYAPLDLVGMNMGSFIITNKAKNPEIAFRWADGLYDYETTLRSNYGRPGEEWRDAEAGEIGINGEPAKWAELLSYGGVQNVNYAQTGPALRSNEFRLSSVNKGEDDLEVILYNETKNNYEPYASNEYFTVPSLYMTNEQATEFADLSKTIHDYVDEMVARFVIGDASLDNEWDTYLKNLEGMNVKRMVEIYQEAYDAQK